MAPCADRNAIRVDEKHSGAAWPPKTCQLHNHMMCLKSLILELATARAFEAGRGYEPHAVAAVSLCFIQRHQVLSPGLGVFDERDWSC